MIVQAAQVNLESEEGQASLVPKVLKVERRYVNDWMTG
jgi:hypothetical protein